MPESFFLSKHYESLSCGFFLYLSIFVLPFNIFFVPLSQNRQALTTPRVRMGMMLPVKRSLFVAVSKIAAALSPSSRLLSYYCTVPLSVIPQTPTDFFVDIYKGFCSFLELQTLSWRLFLHVVLFFLVGVPPTILFAYCFINTVNLLVTFDSWMNRYYKLGH